MKEREFYTTYYQKTKTRHICSICGLSIEDGSEVHCKGRKFNWIFTHKTCLNGQAPEGLETKEMETDPDAEILEMYKNMSVSDLRKLVRDENIGKGTEVLRLSKEELITALIEKKMPVKNPEAPKVNPVNGNGNGGLEQAIIDLVQGKINAQIDIETVETIVNERIDERLKNFEAPIKQVEIVNTTTGEIKNVGVQHKDFAEVLKLAIRRKNIFLVGAPGGGKTHLAEAIAEALNLNFYAISVGLQTSKTDLFGYMDATGNYIKTLFREAYEKGGVFLLDETDAGNGNVLTMLNSATSNKYCAFPDGMVKKHADFILIGAGNTYGKGSDRVFVGRNPLDGATLNRFKFWDFDYDEILEWHLTQTKAETAGVNMEKARKWFDKVISVRRAVETLKERVIVSPRASYDVDLLADGFTMDKILDMSVFQGVNTEVKNRILAQAKKAA